MKLGIFDSGIGGEAVAAALQHVFPEANILVVNDKAHVPYGNRTPENIIELTDAAIQPLLTSDCDIIVLACNTATAAAIDTLRANYPQQRFIGLEPMIKPACELTKTGTIAVCATPATLGSVRYKNLKENYASGINVLEPDCSTWAEMIEGNRLNESEIERTIDTICTHGADVIVLACTHYHWIHDVIEKAAAGRAAIINPSDAIARQVTSLLERR